MSESTATDGNDPSQSSCNLETSIETSISPPQTSIPPPETSISPPETSIPPPETGISPPETSIPAPETSIPPPDASLDDTVFFSEKFDIFCIFFLIILTRLLWQ